MTEKSPLMRQAQKATEVVASWSKSKQEYARRIVNQRHRAGCPSGDFGPCDCADQQEQNDG